MTLNFPAGETTLFSAKNILTAGDAANLLI